MFGGFKQKERGNCLWEYNIREFYYIRLFFYQENLENIKYFVNISNNSLFSYKVMFYKVVKFYC